MATKSTVLQCNNSINKRCLKKTLADQNTEIALEDILKCWFQQKITNSEDHIRNILSKSASLNPIIYENENGELKL